MHNYVKKFYSMIQRGELVVAEGSYNDIEFLHDHWCGIYRGKECNCDPDVVLHREAVTSPRKKKTPSSTSTGRPSASCFPNTAPRPSAARSN